MEKWEGPTTESLEKRGLKVRKDGVVEGNGYIGLFACAVGICVILTLIYFF